MTDDEKDRALCEAHCNSAADEYFNPRPQLDSQVNRRIFYAGHRKAWLQQAEATAPLLARIAELEHALAECRDAYPAPEAGSALESLWGQAMGDPESVSVYVKACALSAAPAAQPEPVAYLWQHSETGRTRVVMPDQVTTADASWIVVGPLYLGIKDQP